MRKTLIAKLALAGTVGIVAAMASGTADAASCVACHTMHNSQDNASMRFDNGATPLPQLLRDDCIGCHSGVNLGSTIGAVPPRVIGTASTSYGTNTLAGGDFYWVATTGDANDSKGHNVNLVSGLDSAIQANGGSLTPGIDADPLGGNQLECAGTYGCHGNPAEAVSQTSMEGAHHYPHNDVTDDLVASEVGNSFRYLLGVEGREDTAWEWPPTAGAGIAHNQYAGERRTDDGAAATAGYIGTLCAKCHASFHNKDAASDADGYGINDAANFAGSWVRHPTDYAMPNSGEFAGVGAYDTYLLNVPVGRILTELGVAEDVTNPNQRIVLCLSCHRAHGSPYDDMLRWDYATMLVSQGAVDTGCFACHSAKI